MIIVDARFKASERGKWAEDIALDYLKAKGLKLLVRNYLAPCGEIDLIMQEKKIIAFIEVRFRTNKQHVSAIESIDSRKCNRIIATSQHYLQDFRLSLKMVYRFDVVAISGQIDEPEIEWIKNAFQA